jgi:hypothetical protein
MATLPNLAIGVLSRAGPVNLAAALRHHARDPARPLATLAITPGMKPTVRENAEAWVPPTNDMAPGGRLGAMRSGVALGLSPAGRPLRPSPLEGRSLVPALDPDRANAMRVGMCRSNQFWVGSSGYG